MFWHFLGWKNKFFQNCSKLPKNHFRTIKILFFFQIFCNYKDGWVGETKSGKFQIFFEPFPNYLIFLTSLRSPIIGEAPKMFKIFPLIFLATNFSINSLDYFYFIETTNFSADSLLLRFRMCGQNLPPPTHTYKYQKTITFRVKLIHFHLTIITLAFWKWTKTWNSVYINTGIKAI